MFKKIKEFLEVVFTNSFYTLIFITLVGFLFALLTEFAVNSIEYSILSGLMFSIFIEMFVLILQNNNNQNLFDTLENKIKLLGDDSQISNLVSVKYLIALKETNGFYKTIDNGIIVDKKEIPSFWTETIGSLESSLRVASFVNPETWWTDKSSYNNLMIQEFKAKYQKPNVDIKRYFIYQTENELGLLKSIAIEQTLKGIKVKYIKYDDIKNFIVEYNLRSFDVAILDNKWFAYHIFDQHRESKELYMSYNNKELHNVEKYLDYIEEHSTEFDINTFDIKYKSELIESVKSYIMNTTIDTKTAIDEVVIDALRKVD